jgi:hypothetical protein
MISSLRKVLLAAVLVGLLQSSASAGDTPPPGKYIEVEIERDTATDETPALEEFREWRFKPDKPQRVKIPLMYQYIPPAVPSGPVLI